MNRTESIVDTNILVYAWNASEPTKRKRAIDAIRQYQDALSLSSQIVAEFSAVMLRNGCSPSWIQEVVGMYETLMPVHSVVTADVKEALRGVDRYRMSYWDAQIWAVAKRNGIRTILTEDGPIGQTIEGVEYVNPLG